LLSCFCYLIVKVNSHGRLMEPPARNAMWRFGYPNPINYNDNELFCGGYAVQWEQNSGKCGVCGDAYNIESPRPHEAGGDYARGYISRRYTAGQVRISF
jgi:Lytic polysaccharide mono-oxygenase, cellulose-degrading